MKTDFSETDFRNILQAHARRITPAESARVQENIINAVRRAGTQSGPAASGSFFMKWPVAALGCAAIAAMILLIVLPWRGGKAGQLTGAKSTIASMAPAVRIDREPAAASEPFTPASLTRSPVRLVTSTLNFAQHAISEQYAMAGSNAFQAAQDVMPQFAFYPDAIKPPEPWVFSVDTGAPYNPVNHQSQ